RTLCTRALMRIRNGALRYSIAWPEWAALGCVAAKAAAACAAGASADLIGACSKWNSRASNPCSHQQVLLISGEPREALAFSQTALAELTSLLDGIASGQRTAPASPPTPSTRSAP